MNGNIERVEWLTKWSFRTKWLSRALGLGMLTGAAFVPELGSWTIFRIFVAVGSFVIFFGGSDYFLSWLYNWKFGTRLSPTDMALLQAEPLEVRVGTKAEISDLDIPFDNRF